MPNIKSAKKRVLVNERRRKENRFVKSTLATYIKKFRMMLAAGKFDEAEKFLPEVEAYVNNASSKGTIHKNTASRKVSRLKAALYYAKNPELAKKATEPKAKKPKEAKPVEAKAPAKAAKTSAKVAPAKTAPAKTEVKAEKEPVKEETEPKAEKKPAAKKAEAKTEKAPAAATKPAAKKTVAKK